MWRRCRRVYATHLEDAALLAFTLFAGQERGAGCVLKDLPNTLVGLGRALKILLRTNLLGDIFGLCGD